MSQQYTLVPTQDSDHHTTDIDINRVTIDDSDSDDDIDHHSLTTQTLASLPSTSAASSASSAAPAPTSLSLTLIRQGEPNRSVSCLAEWTILTLKQRVYPTELADNKLIRVIYLGRVLLDAQRLVDTGIEDGHCLHVLVTDKLASISATTASSHAPNTYQLSSTASSSSSTPPSPVSPYRYPQYIHTASGQAIPIDTLYHTQLASGDPSDPTALPSAGSPSTGTTRDFVVGYVLGFFLGFLACLLLWSTHSSMKQRMGIVCGMMTNIMLGGYVQKERQDMTTGGLSGDGGGGLGVSDGLGGAGTGGGAMRDGGLGEVNGMP